MKINIDLHPYGHECASGSLNCGVFGESFYGIRSSDRQYVTFAMGAGEYSSTMLYVDGRVTEDEFRRAGTYQVALANKSPRCLHKEVFGSLVYYQYTETDRGPMPLKGTLLPDGEVIYIDMQDALHP